MIRSNPVGPAGWILSTALAGATALAQPVLPRPSYETTFYLHFDTPGLVTDDNAFQSAADAISARVPGGPYARVGMSSNLVLNMDWTVDLNNPVLTSPTPAFLVGILARAQTRNIAVHLGIDAGISRQPSAYDAAKLEDRRNAQWYLDGALMGPGQSFSDEVWMTPSRYARKLRRHLEAKVRQLARVLVAERQAYPDILVSASGDGEMELNFGRLDKTVAFDQQMIADYSPFAILEFRDWIQHAGMYAPGQIYDGQGYPGGGAVYQGGAGLAAFNAAFGTFFSSWHLAYFDWSLSDPIDGDPRVDGDPRAIPAAVYQNPGWTPFPVSGPAAVPGGFDAPRAPDKPGAAFWRLWRTFREAMVSHYAQDFAGWITSTPGPGGQTFTPDRWYTHQIPADYLNDTYPGCTAPDPRLITSASPATSGLAGASGSLGLTSFDVLAADGYHRTSHYLFSAIANLHLANWGLPEYSPSWPFVGPDTNVADIASHIREAYDAGAHVVSYDPWPHFATTLDPEAFALFLSAIRGHPRDSEGVSYLPPQVLGLSWTWFNSTIALAWSDRVFSDVSGFRWSDWSGFDHFEVWRGATSDFAIADGQLAATTTGASVSGILPDAARPYYRVLAVNTAQQGGAPSETAHPLAPAGTGFYTLAPCRLIDTRSAAGPLGGPVLSGSGGRTFSIPGACGVPPNARSISVNVTVVSPSAAGFLRFYPDDEPPPAASTINFASGAVRANNAILPLSAAGGLAVQNGSPAAVHLVVDVNGYFQ
jgi:hypothetical protein